MPKLYCEKCKRTLDSKEFYFSTNVERFPPDGHFPLCKKCLTMHVDNWDPETFKPILEQADVPYIKSKWDRLLARYATDPEKITGTTIMGRYLASMRIHPYSDLKWVDTERLEKEERDASIDALRKAGKTYEEITAILEEQKQPPPRPEAVAHVEESFTNDTPPVPVIEDAYLDKLTEEDKSYLRLKWGKNYSCEQWVKLEQLYTDMCDSYSIERAGDKDTLIMICKASVRANELMDEGDIEGFGKMSKVYENLMKSAKLTAAQARKEDRESINSMGELVAICEKEGFIPRYYIEKPNDKVDETIADYQQYVRELVTNEMGLSTLIEQAAVNIQADRKAESEVIAGEGEVDDDNELVQNLLKAEAELQEDEEDAEPETEEDNLRYMEFLEGGASSDES